jgi:glucose-1-phosphate adenylyltransferase
VLLHTGITSRTLTFILAGGNGKRLHPLTRNKPTPLVPFGGIFRVIDFTLSNCVNSHLKDVYLLTQHEPASLHRYSKLVATNPNGPFRHEQSLTCLAPRQGTTYRSTVDAVCQNTSVLEKERPEFVLVLAADHIYKMDYTDLLRRHADSGADLTVAAIEYPRRLARGFGVLEVNSASEVIAFEEKPEDPKPLLKNPHTALVSMGIYVFNTGALVKAVIEDTCRMRSSHDFGRDVIPNSIGSLRVHAYDFTAAGHSTAGYWRDVGTIDSYYRSQMELLLVNSPFDPYNDARWPTYAFGEPDHVSSLLAAQPGWNLPVDSVVSRQSIVSGARIAQSVISRGVCVEATAEIESTVLMPGVRVGRGARIRRAVVDENVEIPDGAEIGYDREKDRRRFRVSHGGVVVVSSESCTTAIRGVQARSQTAQDERVEEGFIPSFEEGSPRRSNKCNATLASAGRGRSN